MIDESLDPGILTQVDGGNTLVTLSGDWTVSNERAVAEQSEAWLDRKDLRAILFDTRRLGRWDSSLLVYLAALRRNVAPRSVRFDDAGIPRAARRLLALLPERAATLTVPARRPMLVEQLGLAAIGTWTELVGLNVGSPVTFRGVPVGKVDRMQAQVDVSNQTGVIPVYMQLEPDKIAWVNGDGSADAKSFQAAVNAGLRAQLRSNSLVTGQLSVDLDFYPLVPFGWYISREKNPKFRQWRRICRI